MNMLAALKNKLCEAFAAKPARTISREAVIRANARLMNGVRAEGLHSVSPVIRAIWTRPALTREKIEAAGRHAFQTINTATTPKP